MVAFRFRKVAAAISERSTIIPPDMIASATTFDTMPQALDYIIQKLDELHSRVDSLESIRTEPQNRWFDVNELCVYLPQHPAPQTVYGWTSTKQIPYLKNGKKVIFLKSEIESPPISQISRRRSFVQICVIGCLEATPDS